MVCFYSVFMSYMVVRVLMLSVAASYRSAHCFSSDLSTATLSLGRLVVSLSEVACRQQEEEEVVDIIEMTSYFSQADWSN